MAYSSLWPHNIIYDEDIVPSHIIWGNIDVSIYNKDTKSEETLLFRNWIDAGIIYLRDLLLKHLNVLDKFVYDKVTKNMTYIGKFGS